MPIRMSQKEITHNIKMIFSNNYRRLHGKQTKRWRQLIKAEAKEHRRLAASKYNPIHIGERE